MRSHQHRHHIAEAEAARRISPSDRNHLFTSCILHTRARRVLAPSTTNIMARPVSAFLKSAKTSQCAKEECANASGIPISDLEETSASVQMGKPAILVFHVYEMSGAFS